MIPYGRQSISDEDIQAVVSVLKSDFLTQGPAIDRFERAVADYCGAKYAVAVCNATAALHIACLSLDLGPGDLLWTSPNTFVASANCGLYCGAQVDFVDIDPATYNMSVPELANKLEKAEKAGRLPKVVVPVHFAGQSCDMEAIRKLSQRYGFTLIEDASHAIGGKYQGKPIGSCAFSELSVFSFHPVKIITTGEGGMVLTNRQDLYERLLRLRSHGITRDASLMEGESEGPWYYQQIGLGLNYRITDMQAALGTSQFKRVDEFVARRHQLADRYDRLLAGLPLTLPYRAPYSYSALHLYPIGVQAGAKVDRKALFVGLRERGVGVNVHYIPVHSQPYYQKLGFRAGDFPASEKYYATAISLPLYFGLTEEMQDAVVTSIADQV